MLWVTLKNGEVRQYNNATYFLWKEYEVTLANGKPIEDNTIAAFNPETVKCVEFYKPCKITYPRKREKK